MHQFSLSTCSPKAKLSVIFIRCCHDLHQLDPCLKDFSIYDVREWEWNRTTKNGLKSECQQKWCQSPANARRRINPMHHTQPKREKQKAKSKKQKNSFWYLNWRYLLIIYNIINIASASDTFLYDYVRICWKLFCSKKEKNSKNQRYFSCSAWRSVTLWRPQRHTVVNE